MRPKEVVERIRVGTRRAMANPLVREKMRQAKLGKPSLRRGTKCTPEQVQRMSKAHLGQRAWNKGLVGCYKQSPETIAKRMRRMRGAGNPAWKGGITPENKAARGTVDAERWRTEVFTRNNWTCLKCLKRGGKLHAHHIRNFGQYPDLRYLVSNGITLCKKCHTRFHSVYGTKDNNDFQMNKFLTCDQGLVAVIKG